MVILIPMGAPDVFPWLYVIRAVFSAASMGMYCHPLIPDYIKKESRGKAVAL